MAVTYFHDLFGQFSVNHADDYLEDILPSITNVGNEILTIPPSDEEIQSAIHNLPKNSAPGPDSFNGSFYQACWPIIEVKLPEPFNTFLKASV